MKRNRSFKIEAWKDNDKSEAYLRKFKKIMEVCEVPESEWARRLIPLLTGKVLNAYSSHVPPTASV